MAAIQPDSGRTSVAHQTTSGATLNPPSFNALESAVHVALNNAPFNLSMRCSRTIHLPGNIREDGRMAPFGISVNTSGYQVFSGSVGGANVKNGYEGGLNSAIQGAFDKLKPEIKGNSTNAIQVVRVQCGIGKEIVAIRFNPEARCDRDGRLTPMTVEFELSQERAANLIALLKDGSHGDPKVVMQAILSKVDPTGQVTKYGTPKDGACVHVSREPTVPPASSPSSTGGLLGWLKRKK